MEVTENLQKKNDLKKILSNEKEDEKDIIVEKEYKLSNNMKELMDMVDNESNNLANKTWPKLNKKNKSDLLNDYVKIESIKKNLNDDETKKLKTILIKCLETNLLNKQCDISYDNINNIIISINILKFDSETKTYQIITKENKVKITPKTKSKSNIDKLLNNSKKKIH